MVSLNSEEDTEEEEEEEMEDDSSVLLPSMMIITEGKCCLSHDEMMMIFYLSCCYRPQLVFLLKIINLKKILPSLPSKTFQGVEAVERRVAFLQSWSPGPQSLALYGRHV